MHILLHTLQASYSAARFDEGKSFFPLYINRTLLCHASAYCTPEIPVDPDSSQEMTVSLMGEYARAA